MPFEICWLHEMMKIGWEYHWETVTFRRFPVYKNGSGIGKSGFSAERAELQCTSESFRKTRRWQFLQHVPIVFFSGCLLLLCQSNMGCWKLLDLVRWCPHFVPLAPFRSGIDVTSSMIWWSKLWIAGDVHKSKEILLAIGTRSLEADIYSYNLVLILGQQIARDMENRMNIWWFLIWTYILL